MLEVIAHNPDFNRWSFVVYEILIGMSIVVSRANIFGSSIGVGFLGRTSTSFNRLQMTKL